ncbi:hypothetical protein [Rosenbergiella australiborealis]|uniref:hypothetical protein n=1 Tax=Rosenbergiella australiborealis TaxID=1544696 RepID=UPI001F4F0C5C|nr:hypothetical protein [Rosenbergiella australiborealis]
MDWQKCSGIRRSYLELLEFTANDDYSCVADFCIDQHSSSIPPMPPQKFNEPVQSLAALIDILGIN